MNILTFDIEDWYCHDNYSQDFDWDKYEVRIHKPLQSILDILAVKNQKATFFCLGWLAEKYPEVIKRIAAAGHEIGCHSYQHQLAYRMDYNEFYNDTKKAKELLEDTVQTSVTSFRAPSFSITRQNPYAFDVLYELGFDKDCSCFPTSRECGGFEAYGVPEPTIMEHNGVQIKEFPMGYYRLLNHNILFSGGGYFRIMPYWMVKYITSKSPYIMSYFHPSDFDPGQPKMKHLPWMRQMKNELGLKGALNKFDNYIKDHHFVSLNEADSMIDWSSVRKIIL